MSSIEILSEENVFGENRYDFGGDISKADLTSFAVLTGASPRSRNSNEASDTGYWWLKDIKDNGNKVCIINSDGKVTYLHPGSTFSGVRPAVKYSLIRPYCKELSLRIGNMKLAMFGEYPQLIAKGSYAYELEENYRNGNFIKTNQSFTTMKEIKNSGNYVPVKNQVYSYDGRKVIKYAANNTFYESCHYNGERIIKGNTYWVLVEPIIWIINEKDDIALSYQLLFGGIPYDNVRLYEDTDGFDDSFLKHYIDNYFSREIFPDFNLFNNYSDEGIYLRKKKELDNNIYGFDLNEVTEEDIIKGAIESDISVFLHGKSSDGKSDRVRKLDPDCEIIYMRNATPESLNGKSVYDASTGKMIDVPPSWYTKIVDKCNREPDKIHLVFFDELTNALPSMQGMAFNIILDREINGKWKLPKNARIVAAGNDLQDSLAANKMAEPLFNRFAHVYINTRVEDWLKWAMDEEDNQRLDYEESKDEQIHPAIISYIENRNNRGINVLRTKFDGIVPNADPRKWDMASKVLYKTNKPHMLRSLIGGELTDDFILFIKKDSKKKIKKY